MIIKNSDNIFWRMSYRIINCKILSEHVIKIINLHCSYFHFTISSSVAKYLIE